MVQRAPRHRRPTRHGSADELPAIVRHRLDGVVAAPSRTQGWVPEQEGWWATPVVPAATDEPMTEPVVEQVVEPAVPPAWRAQLTDRLPPTVRAAAVSVSGSALAGLVLLLVLAVAVVVVVTWLTRPHVTRAPRVTASLPTAAAAAHATTSPMPSPSPTPVLVHVAGAVRRPGLVRLPAGARVDDALRAAGGVTRRGDPASVNLARPVVDGEQIVVLRRGLAAYGAAAAGPVTGSAGSAVTAPPAPVDLNVATAEQLVALPGVGPVLAQRILDWRSAHGRFASVDELTEVSGIGEHTMAALRPLVRV